MPLIQMSEFSSTNTPSVGVLPQPYVSSLGGYTYKYESKGGKRKSKRNHKKLTKKARKNRVSRRTRYNR